MTKKFLLSLLILCAGFTAGAQIKYALRLGGNVTNGSWGGKYTGSSSYKPGFYAGVQMKVPFEPPVYFAPQLNLLHRSTEFSFKTHPDTAKVLVELNQVQLAPFIQYDFHKAGEAGFFVQGSLSLYIAVNGKSTVTATDGTKTKKNMSFSKSAYGRYEGGAHLGFGYETAKKLRIELMYNRGLSNMFNGDETEDYSGPKIKFHTINFGLGWYLN
jgi:Outer membrane protein beta-barrel domain